MNSNPKSLRSFVTQPYNPSVATNPDQSNYPKLTVVTPSFNQAHYLERTILSVLNQKYPNLEYFIIDGGSTDGSVDIIKKYEPYLAGWVSEKDRGQTDAINKGFRQATGDYVAFQNSDDVFAPNAFSRVAEAWRKAPDTDVFFGDMYITDEDDVILEEMRAPDFCLECQIYEGMQVFNQSLFMRRSRLEQVGLLDERLRFVIDYEIVARLGVQAGITFRHVDGFWGGFRVQPDAKSSTIAGTVGLQEHELIKTKYQSMLTSSLGASFWQRYCRLRKLLAFVGKGQFKYVIHRLRLRQAR
ncbi:MULTISPECIES: glycosyltransferase family 2 protein [unclassified Spirosoma]|uniref:glycosyltransferase family 2 protein n=1 Tax=unclassified Spirosoma TaxID=2621999 RepID=UPI000962AE9A|nr:MULTISPECIES: glycosyltransferase family 2 protein [unclassified Spirosoma]MBN8821360.1 glycosyltransferase [Spirosoma sp.]OJW78148.1 MAG: glycosyl transferase [Spirosoma sp. 48-14]